MLPFILFAAWIAFCVGRCAILGRVPRNKLDWHLGIARDENPRAYDQTIVGGILLLAVVIGFIVYNISHHGFQLWYSTPPARG
jgi:hypothetical protein